jgi:hypothetical protein
MNNNLEDNVTIVFAGFLNLNTKEKMQLVSAINDYFDSNNREVIRAENNKRVENVIFNTPEIVCKCCGR